MALTAFVTDIILQARQHLREDNVIWDLKAMGFGLASYARDHDDTYPGTIEDLYPYMFPPEMLNTDLHDNELFRSSNGPAPDGGPDYIFRTDLAGHRLADLPDTTILAVDRAALLRGRNHVFVLMANGSAWQRTRNQLRAMLAQPENHALAIQLGWP